MDKLGIRNEISAYVTESAENRLPDGSPIFEEPLVGFAGADDPLFGEYKTIIGDFHWTPAEILPEAQTVVVWVLPISAVARQTNRREKELPSFEWAWTRAKGEDFNVSVRQHMVSFLREQGFLAAAPTLQKSWRWVNDGQGVGLASNWSERHAAYAAGLGTFGLSDSFITLRGTAHRLGSVVTSLNLSPSPRPYHHYQEYCLHFRGFDCEACVRRCPIEAITVEGGHDKVKCKKHLASDRGKEVYGLGVTGCGFCQTGVPCEVGVPKLPRARSNDKS
ncbi:MAG: 4Fe-4S binding protein [Desulfobaccales bacterium]